jgi:hypothetical protein
MKAELDVIAFHFFKLFAQYEYALKAMKYAKSGRNNQAEPDWDRFSNEVATPFLKEAEGEVADAIGFLFRSPPKRQVLKDDALSWAEVNTTERSAQMLFSHIRRVRNNLYHGGKFNGEWFQPDRSRELMTKSLVILNGLREKNADIQDAIHGNCA